MQSLETRIPRVLKGVEINKNDGDVSDKDIKQGIYQLRYALPNILYERIRLYSFQHEEDNLPFILIPILVTTANLYILNENCKIEDVKIANEITDISKEVTWLNSHYSVAPEFTSYCQEIFKGSVESIAKSGVYKKIEALRKNTKLENVFEHQNPSIIIEELQFGEGYILNKLFSRTIICIYVHIGELFDQIIEGFKKRLRQQ